MKARMSSAQNVRRDKGTGVPRTRTCVVVDDERMARKALINMLIEACPDVHVIAEADSVESAAKCISQLKPDIVFLDIEIIGGTGFDVLHRIDDNCCAIIITTAHEKYLEESRCYPSVTFLYKPVDQVALQGVVRRPVSGNDPDQKKLD